MKTIATFILDCFSTCIQFGIIFGVYYVLNGMQAPTFERLTFGIAFLALFNTVDNARKIRELKDEREKANDQKNFSTSVIVS